MAEREYLVEQEYFNLDKTQSITIKIPKDKRRKSICQKGLAFKHRSRVFCGGSYL